MSISCGFWMLVWSAISAVHAVRTARTGAKRQSKESPSALWDTYVNRITQKANMKGGFQEVCKPAKYEATGPYRGVAMFHHGFTACPNQIKLVVPRLQAKGFTVYTPTFPGMGYIYQKLANGSYVDQIDDLFTSGDEYRNFADEMHAIMMASPGEKVLVGLSVGGGIVAHQNHLRGYDRALLFAPMIIPNGIMGVILKMLAWFPETANNRQSWGEPCEHEEREAGRGGICQMTARNVAASVNIGEAHNNDARREGAHFGPGGLQIIFVEEDDSVSTNAVINLAIKYGWDETSPYICGLDKSVPHAFLALEDNVHDNMWWLRDVNDIAVNYLADGIPAAQSGLSTSGWPKCAMQCTPETCQFGLDYGLP